MSEVALRTYLAEPGRLRYRRIAFLLGAGASYDHGYPLVREFLSPQYFRWLCDQCAALPAGYGSPDVMFQDFLAAVERYRAISEDFEQVLSTVYARRGTYAELLDFVYRALATAYEITLSSEMSSTVEYLGLAAMMLEHPAAGDITIVTFNYDTGIEDALSSMSRLVAGRIPAERLFFNYGFRQPVQSAVSPHILNLATNLPNVYPAGRVHVLKPHGSINMMLCPACAAVIYFPFQTLTRGPAEPLKEACPACSGGPLQRLIVPPGKRKQMPPALAQLWQAAESALATSDIVVITGYSMPEYDVEARDLIGRALRGKTVLLVDPRPSQDAVGFLRTIPGAAVEILEVTTTAFLRSEMDRYDPRFRPALAPGCMPVYLDRHLLQGHPR